jgi:hypothetical protein
MFYRNLARALALSTSLLAGCLVEPSPNAPAGASGVDNRAQPETFKSPESILSPGVSPSPLSSPPAEISNAPGGKLERYLRGVAAGLAPEQRESLGRIEGEPRRLLALRGYLRSGPGAVSRWAWTQARIESYERSPEYAAALAEIEKVRREFEASNPGHTLRVNTKVRSLDEQLSKWNESDSAVRAGEELLARAREEVAAASYGDDAPAADVRRFEGFLRGSTTRVTPTLAVPGLSSHGQSRAFDFQVMRGSQLIAGPAAAGSWDRDGWTEKLQASVRRASAKFEGPLASPREPWHYEYRP